MSPSDEHPTAPPSPILLVTQHYPPAIGGSGVLLENVYSRLPGVAVTVMTDEAVRGSRRPGSVTDVIPQALNTGAWGFSSVSGDLHHLRTARAIRRAARRLGRGCAVHCGRVLPEGVAARLASLAGGPPLSCWVHGEDLATALSSRELTTVTRWVLRGASHVFANSENTRSFALKFGVAPERVTVAYPGVDCQRFHPDVDGRPIRARLGLRDEDTVVLSVGRLQARKGHDVALRALAATAPAFPALQYVIVGSGEERERLDAIVEELRLQGRVHFVRAVSDDELPAFYSAADIFLLPNRVEQGDFEGFGIVFLEAAAAGRPVIGGASGGVVEAVAAGDTGLLVDGARVDAVAGALATLAGDPVLRHQLGTRGRERAVTGFTWENAAARVAAAHQARA